MRNKYNAKRTTRTVAGEVYHFDSMAEARYFDKLMILANGGKVSQLKLQPCYVIAKAYRIDTTKTKSGKSKVGELKYTPDFEYIDSNGDRVVVEVKGYADTSYNLRKKLFLSIAWKEYRIAKFVEVIKGEEHTYDCRSVE